MADEAVERVMGLVEDVAANYCDEDDLPTSHAARAALVAEAERLAAIEAAARAYKAARDHLDETDYEVGAERWAGDYRRIVDAESALSAALVRREGTDGS